MSPPHFSHSSNSLFRSQCRSTEPSNAPTSQLQPQPPTSSTDPPGVYQKVWTTFPASSLPNPKEPYIVMIHLPAPVDYQVRIFCSLEARSSPTSEEVAQAMRLVSGAVDELRRISPGVTVLGATHEMWCAGLIEKFEPEGKEFCNVWLAPEHVRTEENQVNKEGLIVDTGRREDCQIIADSREIILPVQNYYDRMRMTTVLRTNPIAPATSSPASTPDGSAAKSEPVCWIMTNSDGSLSALYTIPEYRRHGLAHWAVQDRLEKSEEMGVRGHCYVFEGNQASSALWVKLGWEKAWRASWVYVRE